MKVLITGANGMVAKAAIAYCQSIGDEVVAKTRQELDIANQTEVISLFDSEKFDAVLNCAAYTNVDGAETNHDICNAANNIGATVLALECRRTDTVFVTISTDYVFDGTKGDFYTQRDHPNPQGFYAQSKHWGEIYSRMNNERSIIVRSGWIFGEDGTNFLSVMHKLLAEGKSIKAISDSFGTPTFAKDLAKRLRELAELDLPAIYHVCNEGEGTTFAEFAEKVCELKGFDKGLVEGVLMDSLSRPAPRPRDSRLKCLFSEKFGLSPLPHWEKALSEFLS
ncbi:MAG TPA: dTDP-4-dehydrorhamnose reductase [Pyrinomonadaceae bacterium]|nr:dTDP-4-dehydrorhamnose reductase [Pyrinomonadaceae bacterium]